MGLCGGTGDALFGTVGGDGIVTDVGCVVGNMLFVDEIIGVAGCMFVVCVTCTGVGGACVTTFGWMRVIGVVGALFFVLTTDVVCALAVGLGVVFVLCAFVPEFAFLFFPVVLVIFAGKGFAPFIGVIFFVLLEDAGGTRVVHLFAV